LGLIGGEKFKTEIERNLRACDIFVLLVSRYSMASYFIVDKEIAIARERIDRGDDFHFYPIVLSPTAKIAIDKVADFNLRPHDGKPLSGFSAHDRDYHMAKIADEIADLAEGIDKRGSPKIVAPGTMGASLAPGAGGRPSVFAAHFPEGILSASTMAANRSISIRSEGFEASVESQNAGNLFKYFILRNGQSLSFANVFDLWENDVEFVDFFISLFKQTGYAGFKWETPAISTASVHSTFEFVIHELPRATGQPDRDTYAAYFDTETAPDGIVCFKNLNGDALLIVPSPYRKHANYSGMAEFLREAPISQQRGLWGELSRHARLCISNKPIWLSIASGGVYWSHFRIDSRPKYFSYGRNAPGGKAATCVWRARCLSSSAHDLCRPRLTALFAPPYLTDLTPFKIASGVHGDDKSGCPFAAVACTASRIAQ
jgi:hypothetical protein